MIIIFAVLLVIAIVSLIILLSIPNYMGSLKPLGVVFVIIGIIINATFLYLKL